MLLTLPLDIWENVLDFLELPDLSRLVVSNKQISVFLQKDLIYERFARRKWPETTLDVASYDGSWKAMLRDGNSENGVYVRNINVVGKWRYNNSRMMYLNSVRKMIWDRKHCTVSVIVEGFGHSDLRAAGDTTIFKMTQTTGCAAMPTFLIRTEPSDPSLFVNRYHDIAELVYEDWRWQAGCSYRYTYNGSHSASGSDYECKEFLSQKEFSSTRSLFGLDLKNFACHGHDEEGNRVCTSIARQEMPSLMEPSDVLKWPVELPEAIKEEHRQRRWGVIGPTVGPGQDFDAENHEE